MSWPTVLPSTAPDTHCLGFAGHSEYTTLFTRIGTFGWSALVSYSESWSESELGVWPAPDSPLAALHGLGLIGFEKLPAGTASTISVLYLTPAGRRRLLEMRLPPVHTEYERLRDRWGTRAEEHHGQVILFATLARRFGYRCRGGGRSSWSTTVCRCEVDRGGRNPGLVPGGIRITSGYAPP